MCEEAHLQARKKSCCPHSVLSGTSRAIAAVGRLSFEPNAKERPAFKIGEPCPHSRIYNPELPSQKEVQQQRHASNRLRTTPLLHAGAVALNSCTQKDRTANWDQGFQTYSAPADPSPSPSSSRRAQHKRTHACRKMATRAAGMEAAAAAAKSRFLRIHPLSQSGVHPFGALTSDLAAAAAAATPGSQRETACARREPRLSIELRYFLTAKAPPGSISNTPSVFFLLLFALRLVFAS